MITPRHNPLPILRPMAKSPRLNLINPSTSNSIILLNTTALFFRQFSFLSAFSFHFISLGGRGGGRKKNLVKSPLNGTIEGPAYDLSCAMDGCRGGFDGVCGLF